MNGAHAHLLVNHFPIFGLFFGLILLSASLVIRQKSLKVAGLLLILVSVVATPIANITGEEAEKVVERKDPGIHELAHEHKEAGEIALWIMVIVGVLAGGALALIQRSHPRRHQLITLTLGVGGLALIWMIQVANLGGRISHPEIRRGYPPVDTPVLPAQNTD